MTEDPTRLSLDPSASALLREDLQNASQHGLAFDIEAGLAQLSASIGTGPGGGPGGGAAGGSTAGAGGLVYFGIGAVGLAGLVVVAVWLVAGDAEHQPTREAPPAQTAADVAEAPVEVEEARRVDETIAPEPEVAAEEQASPAADPGEHSGQAATGRGAARGERGESREPAQAGDPTQREIAQLAEIRRLLASDPARALTLANQGQREFRAGLFTQEREAHAVRALARLGRETEAARRGRRFLARWPDSPHAARIRGIVGPESAP